MWKSALLVILGGLLVSTASSAAVAKEVTAQYRGDYTYGHEVNVFCPDVSSQCYWLSGESPVNVRDSLKQLASGDPAAPYSSVCVLVEGVVDRRSPRTGFAADYDGLIAISRLIGTCAESALVIESDLMHRRWVLASINGEEPLFDDKDGLVPEIDFGEQMQVSGNTGCNRFSGKAELHGEYFGISAMVSTRQMCSPSYNALEQQLLTVLAGESRVTLDEKRNLILEKDGTILVFRPEDWVK